MCKVHQSLEQAIRTQVATPKRQRRGQCARGVACPNPMRLDQDELPDTILHKSSVDQELICKPCYDAEFRVVNPDSTLVCSAPGCGSQLLSRGSHRPHPWNEEKWVCSAKHNPDCVEQLKELDPRPAFLDCTSPQEWLAFDFFRFDNMEIVDTELAISTFKTLNGEDRDFYMILASHSVSQDKPVPAAQSNRKRCVVCAKKKLPRSHLRFLKAKFDLIAASRGWRVCQPCRKDPTRRAKAALKAK